MNDRIAKIILIIISCLLLLFGYSCKEDTIIPDTFGSVFGEVLENGDNVPVAEATISTNPPTSTYLTDAQGRFSMEDVKSGTYTLRIEKDGFVTKLENIAVFNNQTTNALIRLDADVLDNEAPYVPSSPSPETSSTDQLTEITLYWSGGDPDGDELSYDVRLFNSDQVLINTYAVDAPDTSLVLKDLDYMTTYFWQVTAKDEVEEVYGEVWSFTTRNFPDHRFLFAREINGVYQIYSSDGAGEVIPLTDGSSSNWRPRMSPLRDKIAYISNEGVEPQLYTMNRDGSDKKALTTIPIAGFNNLELDYCWSPDGSKLVYMNNAKLYQINRDGNGLALIANAPLGWTFAECDWSGQNNLLAVRIIGVNSYNSQIYTMDTNGTYLQVVEDDDPGSIGGGMFNINGTSILYTADASGFESPDGRQLNSRVLLKDMTTFGLADLSVDKLAGTNDFDARFSPDGASVIFVNTNNDGISMRSIWKMDIDGENRTLLFENAEMPDWR